MQRWLLAIIALIATVASAERITTFAWDNGADWPVGTTVELCSNGICASGLTGTKHTLDVPIQPGETINAQVRAVAPSDYQCGNPPVPCPYSGWATLTQTWPAVPINAWANYWDKSMASVVQYADAYSNQVAFPGNVTSGNKVIIVASGSSAFTSPSRISGTATVGSFSSVIERGADARVQLFYASVTGSGSLTLGYSGGGDAGITIIELNGIDVTTGVEAENYVSSPSQNPSVNLTAATGSILIATLIDENVQAGTVTAGTAPATWTLIGNQTGHQHGVQVLVLSSGITNSACRLNTTGTPGSLSLYQVVSFKSSSVTIGSLLMPSPASRYSHLLVR